MRPCITHGAAYKDACPCCAGIRREAGTLSRENPCRHLGADTGGTVPCPSCRGTVRVKLFACGVHGTCTAAKSVAGHACCHTCPDYAPVPIATAPSPCDNRGTTAEG